LATSGTVGATVVDVTFIIEHAFRRASVAASKITGEQQLSARDNLFLLLIDLANDGVNLWCIAKQLLALVVGQATYPLPVGVADLLRAYSRTMLFPTGAAISTTTTVGLNTGGGNAAAVCTVGVTLNTSVAAQNLVVEYSADGASWTTLYTIPAFTGVAGALYWFDLPVIIAAQAWRVRETVAATIGVSAAQFGTTPNDLLMGRLNRDDYWNLPNKAFPGRPLQYWYDKQIIPQIWVWGVPNDATQLIVCEVHQHVQDIGPFTNQVAVPLRWLNYTIWELSFYCAHSRPKEEVDDKAIERCERRALLAKSKAEQGETDGSRISLMPNIRAYTR
jgi:hypothetical protein